ncbi:MAG: redoxin domain-containing protein [Planctomycetota bacterium]
MMKTLWASVCVAVVTVAPAWAQSAGAVMQRAVEAASGLQSLEMKATLKGEGGFAMLLPAGDATVKMAKARDEGEVVFDAYVEGKIKSKADGDEAPVDVKVHRTLTKTTSVEDPKKLVHELSGWQTRTWDGSLDLYVTPWQLATESPYAREMEAVNVTYEGEASVSGEAVDVVLVQYPERDKSQRRGNANPLDAFSKAKWSFSKADGLPRRIEWMGGGGGLSLNVIVEFSDLRSNTGIEADSFEIATPEGYQTRSRVATTTREGPSVGRVDPRSRRTEQRDPRDEQPLEPAPMPVAVKPAFDPAPDFEVATVDGDSVTKESLAGQVSVFYFWGTWCAPCRAFSPLVSELVDTFEGKPVGVYGLAVRERDPNAPAAFLAEKGYKHTLLLGAPGSGRVGADTAARAFRVRVYPTIAVIGAEGELLGAWRPTRDKTPAEIVGEVEASVTSYLEDHSSKLEG